MPKNWRMRFHHHPIWKLFCAIPPRITGRLNLVWPNGNLHRLRTKRNSPEKSVKSSKRWKRKKMNEQFVRQFTTEAKTNNTESNTKWQLKLINWLANGRRARASVDHRLNSSRNKSSNTSGRKWKWNNNFTLKSTIDICNHRNNNNSRYLHHYLPLHPLVPSSKCHLNHFNNNNNRNCRLLNRRGWVRLLNRNYTTVRRGWPSVKWRPRVGLLLLPERQAEEMLLDVKMFHVIGSSKKRNRGALTPCKKGNGIIHLYRRLLRCNWLRPSVRPWLMRVHQQQRLRHPSTTIWWVEAVV